MGRRFAIVAAHLWNIADALRQEFPPARLQLLLAQPRSAAGLPVASWAPDTTDNLNDAPRVERTAPNEAAELPSSPSVDLSSSTSDSHDRQNDGQNDGQNEPSANSAWGRPRPTLGLEYVDFGQVAPGSDSADRITEQVGKLHSRVKRLVFSGNTGLSPEAWASLLKPLTSPGSGLEDVDFSDCDLDDDSAEEVSLRMKLLRPTVKLVDFRGSTRVRKDGWTALLEPLAGRPGRFEELKFAECGLDDEKAGTIGMHLASMRPGVAKLDFSKNAGLSVIGWYSLLEPIGHMDSSLHEIDFAGCNLDDDKAAAISEQLPRLEQTLEKLILGGNKWLSSDGWTMLLKPLTAAGSFGGTGLQEVDFGWCNLGNECATAIGGLLALRTASVKKLSFAGNFKLREPGWTALLSPLINAKSRIEEVSFGWCELDDASAVAIGKQLSGMGSGVKAVHFQGNSGLSVAAWTALLAPMARKGSQLQEVNFGWCSLDDIKVNVISKQLALMQPTLKKVCFRGNRKLSLKSWAALLRPLTRNRFELVDFGGCDLLDPIAAEIGAHLEAMQSVRKVDFGGNMILLSSAWEALLRPLGGEASSIEEISFASCQLGDDQAYVIGKELIAISPSIAILNFADNVAISPRGWRALLRPLSRTDLRLREVNFESCFLDDRKAYAISQQLEILPPRIRKLNFAENNGVSAFMWTTLLKTATLPDSNSSLEEIDFGACHLDDIRASAIGNQLSQVSAAVKKVDFSDSAMLSAASWVNLLSPMTWSSCNLEEVCFGQNDLDDLAVGAIASKMKLMSPKVRKLDFGGNAMLSQLGWTKLLNPMTISGSALEEVNFADCQLDDVQAGSIGDSLAGLSQTVAQINFRGNRRVSPAAWRVLLQPLGASDVTLKKVDFSNCDLDDASAEAIGEGLQQLASKMQEIDFSDYGSLSAKDWATVLERMNEFLSQPAGSSDAQSDVS